MRNFIVFVFLIAATAWSCGGRDASAHAAPTAGKITSISWLDSARDYGKINEGQKLAVSFRFKNSGANPLVIESVSPGCGCTVADFPKAPIAPGAEGEITGEFNSEGHPGHQHKSIAVKANTGGFGDHQVYFDVDVIAKNESSNDNK